jgi:hypothetical protein
MKVASLSRALLCLCLSTMFAWAVQVKARVIDGRTGKPLAGVPVNLDFSIHPGPTLRAVTDKDGFVVFSLPQPTPPRLLFGIEPWKGHGSWGCSSNMLVFCPGDVFRTGVIPDDACQKVKNGRPKPDLSHLTVAPGEVILFIMPVSRWSWGFHETFGGTPGPPAHGHVKLPRCAKEK